LTVKHNPQNADVTEKTVDPFPPAAASIYGNGLAIICAARDGQAP
jgi:hypothetical protein